MPDDMMGENTGNPGINRGPANPLQMLARVAPQRVNGAFGRTQVSGGGGFPGVGLSGMVARKEERPPLALGSTIMDPMSLLARVQGKERPTMGGVSHGRKGQGWTGFLPLWTESNAGTAAAKYSVEPGEKYLVVSQGVQSCIWQYEPERERDEEGNIREPPLPPSGEAQQPSEPAQPGDHDMMRLVQNSAAFQRVPPMATFRVGGGAMTPRSAGAAGGSGAGGMAAPESGPLSLFEQHRQLRLNYQQDQQRQVRSVLTGPRGLPSVCSPAQLPNRLL